MKLSKATVLVILPITLAFSAGALGGAKQDTRPAENSQLMEEQPVAPLEPLEFTPAENHKALLKSYPFLRTAVKEVEESNEIGIITKTTILTSAYKDEKSGTNLLFVNFSGSAYCGSMGCIMDVYADKGDDAGYQNIRRFSVTEPLYISKDKNGASLVYCDGDGARQFLFSGDTFTETKPAGKNAIKACTFEPQQPPKP